MTKTPFRLFLRASLLLLVVILASSSLMLGAAQDVTNTPEAPTATPTELSTEVPTDIPTEAPTAIPTDVPTEVPTDIPTDVPTEVSPETPTEAATELPTDVPTATSLPGTAPTFEALAQPLVVDLGAQLVFSLGVTDDEATIRILPDLTGTLGMVTVEQGAADPLVDPIRTPLTITYLAPATVPEGFSGLDSFSLIAIDSVGNQTIQTLQVSINSAVTTPTPEPSPTLEASPTPPPVAMRLAETDNFNFGVISNWLLQPGWSAIESEGAFALGAINTDAAIQYGTASYGDVGVQFRLQSMAPLSLSLRTSMAGAYTVILNPDGSLSLLRGAEVLATATAPAATSAWRNLYFGAIGGQLTVIVDGVPVLEVIDAAPLPEGTITLAVPGLRALFATEAEGITATLVDDFALFLPAEGRNSGDTVIMANNNTISGIVWEDTDLDGQRDGGESVRAGVTVRLGLFTTSSGAVSYPRTTTTAADGSYSFTAVATNLATQQYLVEVTLPTGFEFTSPNIGADATDSDIEAYISTGGRTATRQFINPAGETVNWDAGLVAVPTACSTPLDMMIVLDASTSLSASEWENVRSFTRGLINSFNLNTTATGTRIGLVRFTSTATLVSPLSTSRTTLLSLLNSQRQSSGATAIQLGLNSANSALASARPAPIPKVIVLISDGIQANPVPPPNAAIDAAAVIRNQGVVIYSVGVGTIDLPTLQGIASGTASPYVIQVADINQIVTNLNTIANGTCGSTGRVPAPRLLTPVNAGFDNSEPTVDFTWSQPTSTPPVVVTDYQIQISRSSTFATIAVDTTTGNDTPAISLDISPANADGLLYWRVRGWSGNVPGPWSTAFRFTLDTVAPGITALSTPLNGAGLFDSTPAFVWRAPTGTPFSYELNLDDNDTFSSPFIQTNIRTVSFTLPNANALPFGRHYWRVRAFDAAGNPGGWSNTFSFDYVLMRTPLNGAFTTDTTPAFVWNRYVPPVGVTVTGYVLQIDNDQDFSSPLPLPPAPLGSTITTYTIPTANALPYGVYYWRVNVNLSSGGPINSPLAWRVIVTQTPPSVPVLVSPLANAITNDPTPTFTWNASTTGNPASYDIQVCRNTTCTDIATSELSGGDTTFTPLSNLPDGIYYWRVRGLNALGAGSAWSAVRKVTIDTIAPAVPAQTAPPNGSTQVNRRPIIRWGAVSTAVRYELALDTTNPPFDAVPLFSGNATSYTPPAPLLLDTYYWKVRAVDAAGNPSAWSPVFSFIVTSPATDVPILNRFTTNTPTLTWTRITWAVRYEVEVHRNSTFTNRVYLNTAINAPTLQVTLTTMLNGVYYWRVRACDATRCGPWSTGGVGVFSVDS